VLHLLNEPKTISRLWTEIRIKSDTSLLTYDWFVLALDLLYTLNAVEFEKGRLRRIEQ
jgi:hypothetical protein